jgi:plasmid stabilization system protein ParE
MTNYRFTRSAREDLIDIWLYTQENWGEAQADSYQDALHLCCERITAGRAARSDGGQAWLCRSNPALVERNGRDRPRGGARPVPAA